MTFKTLLLVLGLGIFPLGNLNANEETILAEYGEWKVVIRDGWPDKFRGAFCILENSSPELNIRAMGPLGEEYENYDFVISLSHKALVFYQFDDGKMMKASKLPETKVKPHNNYTLNKSKENAQGIKIYFMDEDKKTSLKKTYDLIAFYEAREWFNHPACQQLNRFIETYGFPKPLEKK